MWFSLGSNKFIAKKSSNIHSCDIFVSDLLRIWHKKLSDEELYLISKELNPLLDISPSKNKEIILKALEDESTLKEIQEEEKIIKLKLQNLKMGFRFKFEVILHEENEETVYKEFTLPLLLTVIKLETRGKKLTQMIKDKDTEINEYKQEFGEIKSSYITTKRFSEEEFNGQESPPLFAHDTNIFLQLIQEKEKTLDIKQEEAEGELNPEHPAQCTPIKSVTDTVFKEKNVKIGKSSVKLDHQIIKRRKKHNDAFKIKF